MLSTQWSTQQSLVMMIAPMVAGLVSFTGSSTIVTMILRSETKLSKPFRRIIFGMCIYDIFHSVATVSSAFPSEKGSKMWALGNTYTCGTQGFFNQLGTTGSPMYSLSLAIFYLSVIKFNVRDRRFRKDIEPYLHFAPNLFAWFSAIYVASTGYINSAGAGCWIAPYPTGCTHNKNIECIRGEHAFLYRWIFSGIPILICFVACSVIMVVISFTVISQIDLSNRYRSEMWRTGTSLANQEARNTDHTTRIQAFFSSLIGSTNESDVPTRRASNPTIPVRQRSRASSRRIKDVKEQSILFIVAFLLTYSFTYVNRIVEQVNGSSPFWLHLLARTMISNQGAFNILVYTRPHVTTLRRRNQDLSWFAAFCIVVKRGGDHDRADTRRNSSVVSRASIVSSRPQLRPSFTLRPNSFLHRPSHDVGATVNNADNDEKEESFADDLQEIMNTVESINRGKNEKRSDGRLSDEELGGENELLHDMKKDQIIISEQAISSSIIHSSFDEYDLALNTSNTADMILRDGGSLDDSSLENNEE
mmetsp:Transcript_25666/g.38407  ORF Transcript_25666/g.38407 Transcript_25666/m.38407 type:complete len:532 (-) Transcript_25666:2253-3848(-)